MSLYPEQFRRVRLFVSSTFMDMHAERDYLNQLVFPRVREYCKSRKIEFIPIDLRWGITEEESRNGLVLNACLEEVDQSRPYFIALLGKRYGWIPSEEELLQLRPAMDPHKAWLSAKVSEGASMTEIEIDYATLRSCKSPHAAFYFRSDDVDVSHEYSEVEGSLREKKLLDLKDRLRKQSHYPVIEYKNLDDFGSDIYSRIIGMIEKDYPRVENEDEKILLKRHAFNLELRSRDMLIGKGLDNIIEEWLKRSEPVFLIHGPSGIGTSTELAAVVTYMAELHERFDVCYFDVETVDLSVSPLDELFEFVDRQRIEDDSEKWRIIAIDNAHFFSLSDSMQLLSWLEHQPANLRLVMSSNSGSPMNAQLGFTDVSYNLYFKHGMSVEMRKEYIARFASRFGKRFTPQQIDKLANYKVTPRTLSILLNSLINFGRMEELDDRIDHLIKSRPFYELVYEGLDLFKTIGLANIFARAIIAISIFREGISEEDLLDALKITPVHWAVVKPYIMQFCKGNDSRFYLSDRLWNQDVKLFFATNARMEMATVITDWYMADPRRWIRGLSSIVDAYFDVWHLPDDRIDGNRYRSQLRSLLMNPDTVSLLDNHRLCCLWDFIWFRNGRMNESPEFVYGRSVADISVEEMQSYCTRMAEIAQSLNLSDEAAYYYDSLSKRYHDIDSVYSVIYQVKALIVAGSVDAGFAILKQNRLFENTDIAGFPLTIRLRLTLLISEGYYLQGDWDSFNERSAYAESLEENCSDDFTVEDKVIFCEILCLICQSVVLFGRDEELAELNPLPIEELKDWCSHQEFQLGGRIIAQLMMIEAIRRYRAGLTDDMHRYLCNLDLACYEAFGSKSYQYARAKLIYRIFAWKNGYEIVDYPGNYIRSLDHGHYRKDVRTVDFSSVDQKVRLQLMREYDFFSELDRNTVPPKDRERIALARQEFYDKVVLENDYICERY